MEEKVRQLEAGEGEKCVFYQQQAQRSKAESTTLLAENDQLRRQVDKLSKEVAALRSVVAAGASAHSVPGSTKGKSRTLPSEFEEEDTNTTLPKRPRRSAAVRAQAVVAAASGGSSPSASGSSSSSTSRRLSNASHTSNHPSPTTSFHSNSPPTYSLPAPVFAHSPLHENHPASPAAAPAQPPPPTSHLHASEQPHSTSCGFCSTSTDCLCAESTLR